MKMKDDMLLGIAILVSIAWGIVVLVVFSPLGYAQDWHQDSDEWQDASEGTDHPYSAWRATFGDDEWQAYAEVPIFLNETTTESEARTGCHAPNELAIAESIARSKLESRPVEDGMPQWRVQSCRGVGTPRLIAGVWTPILHERLPTDCPKELNWDRGFSPSGRTYTVLAVCTGIR